MNLKLILPLIIVTVTYSSFIYAGPGSSGGGDDVGIEFQSAFLQAYNTIKSSQPDLYIQIASLDLPAVLQNAKILVVDDPLPISVSGSVQYSAATNDPAMNIILVSRSRWGQIQDKHIQEALALHEVLGLKSIESTGLYPISAQYAAALGISASGIARTEGSPTNQPTCSLLGHEETILSTVKANLLHTILNLKDSQGIEVQEQSIALTVTEGAPESREGLGVRIHGSFKSADGTDISVIAWSGSWGMEFYYMVETEQVDNGVDKLGNPINASCLVIPWEAPQSIRIVNTNSGVVISEFALPGFKIY